MKTLRRAACIVLAAASCLTAPADATSLTTDQSDLWWIPAESGWGMQLVQRGSVIFATLFVYGTSGAATWYTATLDYTSNLTWTGDLYAATGPYFGAVPFNAAQVVMTKVGTMTWAAPTINAGTVSYVVNGVAVTKEVVRQTLVVDNYNGTYLGAFHITTTACTNPTSDGSVDIPTATFVVTQSGASLQMTLTALTTITITGTLAQNGQFGVVTGTYTSTGGISGNATVSAMDVELNSLTASFALNSTNSDCQSVGYLAGIRMAAPN
jgi:hypothetical protein